MIRVKAIQCPNCLDIIYSRCKYDLRKCICGQSFVDGGLDMFRRSTTTNSLILLEIPNADKIKLHNDYHLSKNVFGKLITNAQIIAVINNNLGVQSREKPVKSTRNENRLITLYKKIRGLKNKENRRKNDEGN